MVTLRVIHDPPAAGAWNMAVDEALLETAAATGVATLRFYEWSEPTLSLGYFQSADDRALHVASRECSLVRRSSGGGAIVHDRELTYSFAFPRRNTRYAAASELVYLFHETLAEALAQFGIATALYKPPMGACDSRSAEDAGREPFLCFQRRACGDLLGGHAKIAGSAQRRRRGAVLQHGSILLAASRCAPELPGIENMLGRCLSAAELRDRWIVPLTARLATRPTPETLTSAEHQLACRLEKERFRLPTFTHRR
jgi:lipoyl(octanoyl) transferase